jgi:hypothetical protein
MHGCGSSQVGFVSIHEGQTIVDSPEYRSEGEWLHAARNVVAHPSTPFLDCSVGCGYTRIEMHLVS